MEKNELLKMVSALIIQLGLTSEEVVEYLTSATSIQSPKSSAPQKAIEHHGATTKIQYPKSFTQRTAKVGMYYYAEEELYSAEPLAGKTISGIVAYVDSSGCHGLVIGLRQTFLRWSSWSNMRVEGTTEDNGKRNTEVILFYARKSGKTAYAAEWCNSYAFDGIKAGQAFLPSSKEWEKISPNIIDINMVLDKINLPLIGHEIFGELGDCYWTSCVFESSTYNTQYAKYIHAFDGKSCAIDKLDKNCVRCMITF